jgi:iron(III) transport system ATP-binding protein
MHPDPERQPAAELRGVRVAFGDADVLRGVSLRVGAGEVHALLGSSGAGKTTLLRTLAGLERVRDGSVHIAGVEVDGRAFVPPERRRVGVVFQDYALFPHLSVLENVLFGMPSRDTGRALDLLARVGLDGLAARRPTTLSGGEQQRVALVRALAQEPAMLVLDEPFAHLDARRHEELRDETLRTIRAAGVAAVLVTHDARDALGTADVVHVLHRGRIEQSDPPRALYTRPATAAAARAAGEVLLVPRSGDGEVVQTPLGPINVCGGRGPLLVVRPEWIELVGAEAGVAATVSRATFRGADVRLELRVGDVTVHTYVRAGVAPPEGAEVRVRVSTPCAAVTADAADVDQG